MVFAHLRADGPSRLFDTIDRALHIPILLREIGSRRGELERSSFIRIDQIQDENTEFVENEVAVGSEPRTFRGQFRVGENLEAETGYRFSTRIDRGIDKKGCRITRELFDEDAIVFLPKEFVTILLGECRQFQGMVRYGVLDQGNASFGFLFP